MQTPSSERKSKLDGKGGQTGAGRRERSFDTHAAAMSRVTSACFTVSSISSVGPIATWSNANQVNAKQPDQRVGDDDSYENDDQRLKSEQHVCRHAEEEKPQFLCFKANLKWIEKKLVPDGHMTFAWLHLAYTNGWCVQVGSISVQYSFIVIIIVMYLEIVVALRTELLPRESPSSLL